MFTLSFSGSYDRVVQLTDIEDDWRVLDARVRLMMAEYDDECCVLTQADDHIRMTILHTWYRDGHSASGVRTWTEPADTEADFGALFFSPGTEIYHASTENGKLVHECNGECFHGRL